MALNPTASDFAPQKTTSSQLNPRADELFPTLASKLWKPISRVSVPLFFFINAVCILVIPPPMPSSNLSHFTVEELHKMEGDERENVEKRIKCLRNIQTLLDAAVLQMEQYSHITQIK